MKKSALVLSILLVLALPLVVWGQDADAEIRARVKMLEEGKATQVKLELPSLIAKYQNHPGVLYLQGRLAANGVEAAKFYQSVIDNFPKSEWADDALYHIYLYYYSLGLSRTAELKMQQLRKEYPNSPYIKEKSTPQISLEDEHAPRVIPSPPSQLVDSSAMRTPKGNEINMEMGAPSGAYAIQVGAFSSVENAAKLKSSFEDLGYVVDVQNKVRDGRSLYLVWIGNFKTADEARKFSAEVKAKHKVESIVVTR